MASRISEVVLSCRDPELLGRFWCEVLDFVVLDRLDDGSLAIGPSEGFGGAPAPIILVTGMSRSRASRDCISTSVPPIATRTPNSNVCWRSVPAQPTSARPGTSHGMSWPTRKATSSAC